MVLCNSVSIFAALCRLLGEVAGAGFATLCRLGCLAAMDMGPRGLGLQGGGTPDAAASWTGGYAAVGVTGMPVVPRRLSAPVAVGKERQL